MATVALIPEKEFYAGEWKSGWDDIVATICPKCKRPIGYDNLADKTQDGWEHATCPEVKVPCQVYSRIVGYMTPIDAWNQGKQAEFSDRVVFDQSKLGVRDEAD